MTETIVTVDNSNRMMVLIMMPMDGEGPMVVRLGDLVMSRISEGEMVTTMELTLLEMRTGGPELLRRDLTPPLARR